MLINKTEEAKEKRKSQILTKIIKNNPGLVAPLKEGESLEGELIYKDNRCAFFDLGGKGTGILFGVEFLNAKDILKNINTGEKCSLTISGSENEDGYYEVSLIKALWKQNWQEVKKLKEEGESIIVKITGANTGGLLTELFGIKAFIPVSQLSAQNYPHVEDGDKNKILEELKKLIGQDLEVKILDFNPKEEKLILSEREVSGEEVRKILEGYKVGDIVEVIVSGVADFGVFVKFADNPNIEGLVHISEIDHKLIDSPKEVVKVNDSLRAKIIEIKDGRVSLSFKALKPNPWDEARKYFAVGQEVKGKITKINPFGALVYLGYDLQGLIHVSEFENQEKMKNCLEIGKEYDFIISQLKPEEKRIILKLKNKVSSLEKSPEENSKEQKNQKEK